MAQRQRLPRRLQRPSLPPASPRCGGAPARGASSERPSAGRRVKTPCFALWDCAGLRHCGKNRSDIKKIGFAFGVGLLQHRFYPCNRIDATSLLPRARRQVCGPGGSRRATRLRRPTGDTSRQPTSQGVPRRHALSRATTTPAHDHAMSPLHAHAHSTRTLARVRVAPP